MVDGIDADDPALVHVVGDPARPGIHVLLIGIGRYDYLPGGEGPVLGCNEDLRQLGSPPLSARALADRFVRAIQDQPEPVGSVALILSECPQAPYINPVTGGRYDVPRGTVADVKAAVRAWAKRLGHRGSVSVFAFLGHGYKAGFAEVLLLRDFGEDSLGLFDGSMDFNKLKSAMERMAPDRQVFFIDACRVSSVDLPLGTGGEGASMLSVPSSGRLGMAPPAQCISYATSEGMQAYGPRDATSFYTRSLLLALGSAAEQDEDGNWWVATSRVQDLIEHETSKGAAARGVEQAPDVVRTSNIRLFLLPAEPQVPVFVRCSPEASIALANLVCHCGDQRVDAHHGPHSPDVVEWRTTLGIGSYVFSASFPGEDGLSAVPQRRWVFPPFHALRVAVQGFGA